MHFVIPKALLVKVYFGATIDELIQFNPDDFLKSIGSERTKWVVQPGSRGTGRIAFAVLKFDKSTGETLVFGAIERDYAPEHEHLGGETIFTLQGFGLDVTDDGEPVNLGDGSIITHAAGSVHSPGSDSFWVFVYYQPRGMKTVTQ